MLNMIKIFVGACSMFFCMTAMATIDVPNADKVVAIQMCTVSMPEKITYLQVVNEGKFPSVSGVSFNLDGDTPMNESWEFLSSLGQPVASFWAKIDNDSVPTFVIVDNQVLPIVIIKDMDVAWTEWDYPKFNVENGRQWAISKANSYQTISGLDVKSSNFRFRFKIMLFADYLANMPKYNVTKSAWDNEKIPSCK